MTWKNEYINLLGCSDPNKLDIENAQKLLFANMPKYLYKYRRISSEAISNLESDTVWLNNPSEYNDPFECAEYFDISKVLKAQFRHKLDDILGTISDSFKISDSIKSKLRFSSTPKDDLFKYICEENGFDYHRKANSGKIKRVTNELLEKPFRDKIKDLQETLKVSSFCEQPDNLLMWSHYTNNHEGFCIEYNISKY